MSRWKKISGWPLGHYVAFADDLTPIAHGPGKQRTREIAQALGCWCPLIVPAIQLKENTSPDTMLHDS